MIHTAFLWKNRAINMSQSSASTYNPADQSLEERIKAFQKVYQDYKNIETCLKSKSQFDSLGTSDELIKAHEIAKNSVNYAIQSLNHKEIIKANEEGLLSRHEVDEAKILKAQTELPKKSSKKQHSKSHSKK